MSARNGELGEEHRERSGRDNDLLDLMQDEGFRSQYPHLLILNPVALLRLLTPPSEEQPCSDKAAPPLPD